MASLLTQESLRGGFPKLGERQIIAILDKSTLECKSEENLRSLVDLWIAVIETGHPILRVAKKINLLAQTASSLCSFSIKTGRSALFAALQDDLNGTVVRQSHGIRLLYAIQSNLGKIHGDPANFFPASSALRQIAATSIIVTLQNDPHNKLRQLFGQDRNVFDVTLSANNCPPIQEIIAGEHAVICARTAVLLTSALRLALVCCEDTAENSKSVNPVKVSSKAVECLAQAIDISDTNDYICLYEYLACVYKYALRCDREKSVKIPSESIVNILKVFGSQRLPPAKRLELLGDTIPISLSYIDNPQELDALLKIIIADFEIEQKTLPEVTEQTIFDMITQIDAALEVLEKGSPR